MTSLIDVIFLLLLFFMLSSTFSRFAEVELSAAGQSATAATSDTPPLFLRLASDTLSLNGREVTLDALPASLAPEAAETPGAARTLLLSLAPGVTSQRLTDVLVALRGVSGIAPTVLGGAS